MKRCPVCSAMVFDDMETCFSCLHRFDEDPSAEMMRADVNGPDGMPHREDALGVCGSAPKTDKASEHAQSSSPSPATRLSAQAELPSYRLEITLVPVAAKDAVLA